LVKPPGCMPSHPFDDIKLVIVSELSRIIERFLE
jgi:hypothetical protein